MVQMGSSKCQDSVRFIKCNENLILCHKMWHKPKSSCHILVITYFFLVCANALPATDLESSLNRLSLRILDAFLATFLEVCFLFGIV